MFIFLAFLLAACSGNEETTVSDESQDETQTEENEAEEEEDQEEEETTTEDDLYGGTLNFAFNAQPPTLDPMATTATATRDIARHIFEQLVTFDSHMEVQPMLAESFVVDEDANTVTFNLRKGVTFHNGKEMKAEDVVASMEKWAVDSAQARSFLAGVTFEEVDEYTVVAKLEKTGLIDMFIFADLTQIAAIMPKEVIENAGESGLTEYIGTGPYKFEEWRQDQYVHLTRYEDYVGLDRETDGLTGYKAAYVDEIYFHFVTDASTRVAGLQSGDYHLANFIPQDSADMLAANPEIEIRTEISSFPGLVFNKKEGVMSNKLMRQAMNAALDVEAMMKAAYGSEEFYSLNHELMLEEQTAWYTDAGKDKYNQKDLDKARELLEEAGYNGEEITIITSREYEDYYTFAVVVQEQMKEIGLNIKLDVIEWAAVLERRDDPSAYDIFITGWGTRPTPVQYPFLDSRAEWPGWTNSEEIDRIIDEIQATTSQEEALKLTAELQEEMWDYLPIIKPGNKKDVMALRTEISGFDTLVGPILWNISISQ